MSNNGNNEDVSTAWVWWLFAILILLNLVGFALRGDWEIVRNSLGVIALIAGVIFLIVILPGSTTTPAEKSRIQSIYDSSSYKKEGIGFNEWRDSYGGRWQIYPDYYNAYNSHECSKTEDFCSWYLNFGGKDYVKYCESLTEKAKMQPKYIDGNRVSRYAWWLNEKKNGSNLV